ncbi:MAG TPA: hypothetical protein VII97_09630 [Anaerolineales bacterium]
MEKKQNRTWAIVGTIAAILLCGCPGLSLCVASLVTVAGIMPYTTTINGYTTTGIAPVWMGVAGLCVSVLFIAIAVVVPVLTLRKKKDVPEAASMEVLPPQDPLPPAS